MTGIVSHNPRFSRLTFALLEDSGWVKYSNKTCFHNYYTHDDRRWYKADYSYAENILWGANSGCDFASASCKAYMDSQTSRF